MKPIPFLSLLLLALPLLWGACTHAPQTVTYVLPNPALPTTHVDNGPGSGVSSDSRVGPEVQIDDIQLAHYLNQGGFVIKNSKFEITVTKQNRWGEPLKSGIQRYLNRAFSQPSEPPSTPPNTPVVVHLNLVFDAFESIGFETAVASGAWTLSFDDLHTSPITQNFHYEVHLSTPSYSGIVEADAHILDALAKDIRRQLQSDEAMSNLRSVGK